ncbi:hypothetical protein [Pseudosulfitobacter pseudonitzschiae]|uniref:hypothetical protein n=1 Tax=Pseudosulfitobacter pseudonitzschiae TaxID=1402135 RepID=UPI003B81AFE7
MSDKCPARPEPKRRASRSEVPSFQARVDYIAKALVRGSWGRKFDECFEQHDSNHVIAVVMSRAERNETLKSAIIQRFEVASWEQVPWYGIAEKFSGQSARRIRESAEEVRKDHTRIFKELYADPERILDANDNE